MFARGTSWRFLIFAICIGLMQSGTAWRAVGQSAADGSDAYLLGTASTGGTYHPVGVALSTLIKLKLLPTFDVDLTAINTDGSTENIKLLREDDIQFAIVSALAGHEARTGTGAFSATGADDDLRAIMTLWLSTDHVLVRDDVVESGTIEDFLNLKGRPVSLGRPNSGTLSGNRKLLAALGADIETEFDLVELGYNDSAEALDSGDIDAMSVSGGVPIGAVQEAFETLGERVAVLEISDEQLALIDGGRRIWQRAVIPNGTYPGQNRDIYTIGTPNILAVRADVDEEVVYQITRTIFQELDYLHGLHATTRQITLNDAVSSLPLPIHEGAARYYAEEGVELPKPPVSLDSDLLARYPTVEEARDAANRGVVTMFAGTEGDTSTRVAAELATALESGNSGVRLLATNGGGIGNNLSDLLYLRGVDTALIREDILNYAQDQAIYPAVQSQVNYITEMFSEEIHLLVGRGIASLEDLNGKTINLGASGSGTDITGAIVLSKLGLNAETTNFGARGAIEKLEQGEIHAAFFVGGKPMPLLRQIPERSGLKLLALPVVEYFDSYRPADISGYDYPNLMSFGETLPTIAVRTALLTYAWRPDSARYEVLGRLTDALFENLLVLQDDGFHPKWWEVDPTTDMESWQRFPPASRWIDDNEGTARRIAGEGRLRLQQHETRRSGVGGGQPLLIESEGDEGFVPDPLVQELRPVAVETSKEASPSIDHAADTAASPTEPAAPPSPAVRPASERPSELGVVRDGSAANGSGSRPFTVPRDLSKVPTSGANNPTF
ncbi:MAG: TAXI family TRAP transporter solute-binding subunit [Pseudomonadota bacterium]